LKRQGPFLLKTDILQDGTFKTVFNLQPDEFRIYDPWQPIHYRRYSGAIVSHLLPKTSCGRTV
jgi:hypothetical protein